MVSDKQNISTGEFNKSKVININDLENEFVEIKKVFNIRMKSQTTRDLEKNKKGNTNINEEKNKKKNDDCK